MGFQRHKTLLPERGPTPIGHRTCFLCDGVGGRGAGSTRGVGGLVFPRAVVEHGKIGACERFCASVHQQLIGAGGGDDFGRDESGYGVEWALAGP